MPVIEMPSITLCASAFLRPVSWALMSSCAPLNSDIVAHNARMLIVITCPLIDIQLSEQGSMTNPGWAPIKR